MGFCGPPEVFRFSGPAGKTTRTGVLEFGIDMLKGLGSRAHRISGLGFRGSGFGISELRGCWSLDGKVQMLGLRDADFLGPHASPCLPPS